MKNFGLSGLYIIVCILSLSSIVSMAGMHKKDCRMIIPATDDDTNYFLKASLTDNSNAVCEISAIYNAPTKSSKLKLSNNNSKL